MDGTGQPFGRARTLNGWKDQQQRVRGVDSGGTMREGRGAVDPQQVAPATSAVDEFVRASWAGLYRSAYLLTGSAHDAEDAVQTALAVVVERWETIRRTDDPAVYARRVLANHAYRRARRRRLELDRLLHLRSSEQTRRGPTDPGEDLVRRDELFVALQELPPRMRAAVVLRFLEDLSEKDTAAALGCSVGTVKSQTSKALAQLRGRIGEGVTR